MAIHNIGVRVENDVLTFPDSDGNVVTGKYRFDGSLVFSITFVSAHAAAYEIKGLNGTHQVRPETYHAVLGALKLPPEPL
jgi:hypothetical protein